MDDIKSERSSTEINFDFRETLFRYLNYWQFYLLSIAIFALGTILLLRYSSYYYKSQAKIEIIDKAQDSEMALPTEMTVFNRSMINLENEIGVLSSRILHARNISNLKSNVLFYSDGIIRNYQTHPNSWLNNFKYNIEYKFDTDTITHPITHFIKINQGQLQTKSFDINNKLIENTIFSSLSTKTQNHNLPFDLEILDFPKTDEFSGYISFNSFQKTLDYFIDNLTLSPTLKDSDQLNVSLIHRNVMIADEYLDNLINEFDKDGIMDRQLEYKRTMDFVDSRAIFLKNELTVIENKKQEYKQKNNLSELTQDAALNIEQKITYNSELFNTSSQLQLINALSESLNEGSFNLLPINIGIENFKLNNLLENYNELVLQRENYLMSAGINNSLVKNAEKKINNLYLNIIESIENSKNNLQSKIFELENKEKEYEDIYGNVPVNERVLRAIERELEVKESLFLLLLQKREEAAINFAVIKPSIKVIDYAISSKNPVYPNTFLTCLVALSLSFFIPTFFIFFKYLLDNKIHNRSQLDKHLVDVPVVAEIPHIIDVDNQIISKDSRSPLAESVRMLIANFKFLINRKVSENVVLFTSSIKGEGKTIISINTAKLLSLQSKVLLIGSDLRNPQIHNFVGIERQNFKGVSDYIVKDSLNWKDLIYKYENLDILLSGTIPPNPNELLAKDRFKYLINDAKKHYDYVIIDTAPCLLVSDTFEISKLVDSTIYIFRANHTPKNLTDFINDLKKQSKLPNISVVLNDIGSNDSYAYVYKYGYRYNYTYNYGYGYGYEKD